MITMVYTTKEDGTTDSRMFNHDSSHEMKELLYMIHQVISGEYNGVKITMQTIRK